MGKILQGSADVKLTECKFCASTDIVKNGSWYGTQRWLCRNCGRAFVDNKALPKMKHPVDMVANALSMYFRGMSERQITNHFKQQYGYAPNRATIYRWVQKMAKIAIDEAYNHTPEVGDTWVADETNLFIGGDRYWLFDIIDTKTRFLLATRLTPTRSIDDVRVLVEKAAQRAGKPPKTIRTDSMSSYEDGIELAFGSETKHVKTKGLTAEINTNIIERWHGTLKDRIKVLRGFKQVPSALTIIEGWLTHYNFFRPHESLNDRTPAQAAGITAQFQNWADVVQSQKGIIGKPEAYKVAVPKQVIMSKVKPTRKRRHKIPKSKISPKPKQKEIRINR